MTARTLILAFCLSWAPAAALAQDLPSAPVLRIEPGMHTAPIMDAETDQARDLLVTSGDSTVRIWALPELRLVRVLRPPIGPGNEGSAGAVALTPDGKIAAVGGWPAAETGQYAVDLFDVATVVWSANSRRTSPSRRLPFPETACGSPAGSPARGFASGIWPTGLWRRIETTRIRSRRSTSVSGVWRLRALMARCRLYAATSQDAGLHPQPKSCDGSRTHAVEIAFLPRWAELGDRV